MRTYRRFISPLLVLIDDQVKKLSSFGFKATFVGPERERDPKILQGIERKNVTFVYICPESKLTTERCRNTLESEIYQETLIGVAVVKSFVLPTGALQATTTIVQLNFRVWYFRDSRNFNYAILAPGDLGPRYGILFAFSGSE